VSLIPALLAGIAVASEKVGSSRDPVGFEPARIGTTRAELTERFGDALRVVEVTVPRSLLEQIAENKAGDGETASGGAPFAGQERLGRSVGKADVRSAEYDLFQGVVFRTRWRMDERLEQPVMPNLVPHLTERLGEPVYDQTIEAKLGSGKSDLRRVGWRRGDLTLEIRQLHPFTGGPLFVSLSDVEAMDRIVNARGVVLPQPDSTAAWWSRPQSEVSLPASQDRERLLRSVDVLLARLEFEKP
jgi:hypothetical protein